MTYWVNLTLFLAHHNLYFGVKSADRSKIKQKSDRKIMRKNITIDNTYQGLRFKIYTKIYVFWTNQYSRKDLSISGDANNRDWEWERKFLIFFFGWRCWSPVSLGQHPTESRTQGCPTHQYINFSVGAANDASLGALMFLCTVCSCELVRSFHVNSKSPTHRAKNDSWPMSAMLCTGWIKCWIYTERNCNVMVCN